MAEPAYPLAFPERTGDRVWPAQGHWTYDDYRLLPADGQRYEVIRGHLYVSAAPSVEHQSAVGELYLRFKLFLRENDLGNAFVAPLDILLPREIASPVQPDLVVFLKENQVPSRAPNVRGVPDLLAEVLSPSTRRLDTETKLPAYRDASVPEVWLADPQARKITVHVLSEDGTRYVELCRGGQGERVFSRVLPGLQIEVGRDLPAVTTRRPQDVEPPRPFKARLSLTQELLDQAKEERDGGSEDAGVRPSVSSARFPDPSTGGRSPGS